MGLKSGSRDSGLDDEEEPTDGERKTSESVAEQQDSSDDTVDAAAPSSSVETDDGSRDATRDESDLTQSQPSTQSVESIPYKLRRNQVNEGREQVPYFLRPEVTDAESDLKSTLEAELDETVYKSDYREAAMVLAQRNPNLVAEILREWGYDFGH